MRQIDQKHTITDEGKLIKASTGEEIPETEPTILFRGRDRLALPMLEYYKLLCKADGATDHQLESVDTMIAKFASYAANNNVKQPGITEGKPWDGTPS